MTYQLSLLKLPVTNVEVSSSFYVDVLGWKLLFVAKEYGWAQLESGEASLALYEVGKGGGSRTIGGSVDFHLCLGESDFDEVANKLIGTESLVDNMIHTGNDGSTFIDVLDPDGNSLKIMKRQT